MPDRGNTSEIPRSVHYVRYDPRRISLVFLCCARSFCVYTLRTILLNSKHTWPLCWSKYMYTSRHRIDAAARWCYTLFLLEESTLHFTDSTQTACVIYLKLGEAVTSAMIANGASAAAVAWGGKSVIGVGSCCYCVVFRLLEVAADDVWWGQTMSVFEVRWWRLMMSKTLMLEAGWYYCCMTIEVADLSCCVWY